ncbi:MAG: lipoyl synthase [Desulfuromusa sp.]|jgi:lipoic acid synthetase|nr:lipoyl synthase [Desulfuromusa sp.]
MMNTGGCIPKVRKLMDRPSWIRAKAPDSKEALRIKKLMRDHSLHTVCESASCPNLGECFKRGTATFMIMGDTCTRNCPFCNVTHGTPASLDNKEPESLQQVVASLDLQYVVITSVTRDDLTDGGADHFVRCIKALRHHNPSIKVEILVPDFRGRTGLALGRLSDQLPDVFNHNIETVPRLYAGARPGADYHGSLQLLWEFKQLYPRISTKSGLMVGLGETDEEIYQVMHDLRRHGCDLLTVGQYLSPSRNHLPVERFVSPEEFEDVRLRGLEMGFREIASGPLVRSSYKAEVMQNLTC